VKRIDFEYYWTEQQPVDGKIYGVKEILQDADTGGIDLVLLIAGPIASPNNRGLAKFVKDEPRLIGCCQINPLYGQPAVEELEFAATVWNMPILKLMSVACNYSIYGQAPLPVLDKARELELLVNIHSGAYLSTPAQVGVVAARYPDLPIIMEHMGYRDGVSEAIEVAKVFTNVHLGTNTVAEPLMIKRAVQEIGPERVCFASNGPGVPMDFAVESIRRLKLGEEAEGLVLGGNLARLLGIE
jgi:predicted TIM-barrel fold metal-dependent hydrolase